MRAEVGRRVSRQAERLAQLRTYREGKMALSESDRNVLQRMRG